MSNEYNNRTIRIHDTAHAVAKKLSDRFGISQAAVIEALLIASEDIKYMTLPPRDRSAKFVSFRKPTVRHKKPMQNRAKKRK